MTQGQRNGYQEELQILNQAVQESEKKLSECRAQIAQFSTDNVKNNRQIEDACENSYPHKDNNPSQGGYFI